MNNRSNKRRAGLFRGDKWKNLVISIVILVEVIVLLVVASFSWVETVSSIKILSDSGIVDSFVFTEAGITSQTGDWTDPTSGVIDLGAYFKKSGDMHLAPASSADGKSFFFPQVGSALYRKGTADDKNTAYMSISFKVRAETNVDFFFYKPDNGTGPSFSGNNINANDIRVSVTAYSEGADPDTHYDSTTGSDVSNTSVYALTASTANVVNSTSGGTAAESVEAISDHTKGKASRYRLFSVGAEETKIVTVNLWLQSKSSNMNGSTAIANDLTISDFGLISSLTPRHVTLVPTSIWNSSNPTYYAWCYSASNGASDKLFKLRDNGDGSYSFDYPGNYTKVNFVRAKTGCTVADGATTWAFGDGDVWNQTQDVQIPDDPVDPTFFITTMTGGTNGKSNGVWEEPAVIKLKYVDGQDTSWGTLSGSFSGFTASYDNSDDVKEVRLVTRGSGTTSATTYTFNAIASVTNVTNQSYSDYAFVGWYTDSAGTTAATGFTASTSGNKTTSAHNTPAKQSAPTETVYYAKFKQVRTIKVTQLKDGSASNASVAGKVFVDSNQSTATASKTVDMYNGTDLNTVTLHGEANTGYTLSGIYTTTTGGTEAATGVNKTVNGGITYYTVNADSDKTYYARFTTNTHSVNLYTIGNTGSTVQYGSETAAASVSKSGVKYNTSVTIKANPAGGYDFVGWYTSSDGSGDAVSTNASYTFILGDNDVTYYAKFKAVNIYLTGWLNNAKYTGTSNQFTGNGATFTFTTKFTDDNDGYQYVTIYDGTNAYHPTENAGSGTKYDKIDNSPGEDYKWQVAAPKGATVTFTWDHTDKELSWTVDTRDLYLKPGTNWLNDSARFAVYAYNSKTDYKWFDMTQVSGDSDTYVAANVPTSYAHVIFVRMNGSTSENNWDNKWNQTGDLDMPSDCNLFTKPNDTWNGATTTWGRY